jgi:hypothetical protein
MRRSILCCDSCGNIEEHHPLSTAGSTGSLSGTWHVVDSRWHFCCWGCVSDYAASEAAKP